MAKVTVEEAREVVVSAMRPRIIHWLIVDKGFTEKGAAKCYDNFIATMRFAGLLDEWCLKQLEGSDGNRNEQGRK